MIDWRRGGWTGSLNAWVRREVGEHVTANPVIGENRYPWALRVLRILFAGRRFTGFVGLYLVLDVTLVLAEAAASRLVSAWLPEWTLSRPEQFFDIKTLITNVTGYLIGAQVGALGIVAIAIALVTLIAQRDDSRADVQVYYYESLCFGVVASCLALLAVLCVQLLWPLQFLLHKLGEGTNLQVFKLLLLGGHIGWLALNLTGLAYFITVTLRFVQQPARERLRRRYTVNAVVREDLTSQLRQTLYVSAGKGLVAADDAPGPTIWFGYDIGRQETVELESTFKRGKVLYDVRMEWVKWTLRRWWARCLAQGCGEPSPNARARREPDAVLAFPIRLDVSPSGRLAWCRREDGVPLDCLEKWILRRSFVFRKAPPTRPTDDDLPRPDRLLLELADKAAAQIDLRAPVAFSRALDELVEFHRFLLAAFASSLPDGRPFNFAQVGGFFSTPHREWTGQYRRLHVRAAEAIIDDPSYFEKIANIPGRLLPRADDPRQSDEVVCDILDLGLLTAASLESWLTKRTVVTHAPDGPPSEQAVLTGAERIAYERLVPHIVGTWESLLNRAPQVFGARRKRDCPAAEQWDTHRASWAFFQRHLHNNAVMLAMAALNEDRVAAMWFRDMLIRWRPTEWRMADGATLRFEPLLSPAVVAQDWDSALARIRPHVFAYNSDPGPDVVFRNLLRMTHNDVVLLTAAVLLNRIQSSQQASGLGADEARALLAGTPADGEDAPIHRRNRAAPSFRELFLGVLRLEFADGETGDDAYGKALDGLVEKLNGTSKRMPVPGRVYISIGPNDRRDLDRAFLAILLTKAPMSGDGGVGEAIGRIIEGGEELPGFDAFLGDARGVIRRFTECLDESGDVPAHGASALDPSFDFAKAKLALRRILDEVDARIAAHQAERLRRCPIDPATLERIRAAAQSALLAHPAGIPFFRGFAIERIQHAGAPERQSFLINLPKDQLVETPRAGDLPYLQELIVENVRDDAAWRKVWAEFVGRHRLLIQLPATAGASDFWRAVVDAAHRIGTDPVLLASNEGLDQLIRDVVYSRSEDATALKVEHKSADEFNDLGGSYVATIEGIDVYEDNLPSGTAWLFSAHELVRVNYAALDEDGRLVDLSYVAKEDNTVALRFEYAQMMGWVGLPAFEIHLPASRSVGA